MFTKPPKRAGFTLVEAIVFLVVVSTALAAILNVFVKSSSAGVEPVRRKQAQMIAEALLEEVMLARMTFCDPASPNWDTAASTANCAAVGATAEGWGPEGGNARPFDNVNDYVSGSGVASTSFNTNGSLVDANGNAMAAGYTATVSIVPVAINANSIPITNAGSPDNGALSITVTVSYDSTQTVSLSGIRTRYAPLDQ